MNGYELSRNWFDWCFDNATKIKPIHTALYFFIVEHNNRLGWKAEFGLPRNMVMDAIGVKNNRTFTSAFNDLEEWGFIEVLERSKNQHSANIITLTGCVKNTPAPTKALDKAMQKHVHKQYQKQVNGTAPIDKPLNQEPNNQEQIKQMFDEFWEAYDKKTGRTNAEKKWSNLSQGDRELILQHVPKYVKATPDKQYRKNPTTYLNQKTWLDEDLPSNSKQVDAGSDISDEDLLKLKYMDFREIDDKETRLRYCNLKGIKRGSMDYRNIVEKNQSIAF